MKFGKYLSGKKNEEWADGYLDYDAIKHLIKEAVRESEALGSGVSFSPRETSLSVQRATNNRDAAEERFFTLLESEVSCRVGSSAPPRACRHASSALLDPPCSVASVRCRRLLQQHFQADLTRLWDAASVDASVF